MQFYNNLVHKEEFISIQKGTLNLKNAFALDWLGAFKSYHTMSYQPFVDAGDFRQEFRRKKDPNHLKKCLVSYHL